MTRFCSRRTCFWRRSKEPRTTIIAISACDRPSVSFLTGYWVADKTSSLTKAMERAMSRKAEKTTSTDLVRRVTWDRVKKKKLPDFTTGDTVGVYVKVKEGEKERVQLFSGVVLKVQ